MRRVLFVVAVAAAATLAANVGDVGSVSLKVTGVAVADDTKEGRRGAKFLPPETRVVVSSDKQFALFRVEYDVPTNMNVRIFLGENGDMSELGCGFGSSPSGLHSGTGVETRILHLDADIYDIGVLLKSVRLFYTVDAGGAGDTHYVCDVPVNVLFAKDGEKKTDGFRVLEPLSPPPAKSVSLLPGWTEDFKAARAQAAKEGKLVLAYFLNSRKNKEDEATTVLDHEVLGSGAFLTRAGKSCVCYMAELHKPYQSWMAQGNMRVAFRYAARDGGFSPPEVAIIHPDGSRMALLGRKGWGGGVDGYLAKIEKGRKAALAKREA